MNLVREALGEFLGYLRWLLAIGYFTDFQHFCPRVLYVRRVPHREYARGDRKFYSKEPIIAVVFAHVYYTCVRFRMMIHAKGGMVRFQRAYHHGCSPTFMIRAHDSAS